jgi:hypothetical protein
VVVVGVVVAVDVVVVVVVIVVVVVVVVAVVLPPLGISDIIQRALCEWVARLRARSPIHPERTTGRRWRPRKRRETTKHEMVPALAKRRAGVFIPALWRLVRSLSSNGSDFITSKSVPNWPWNRSPGAENPFCAAFRKCCINKGFRPRGADSKTSPGSMYCV